MPSQKAAAEIPHDVFPPPTPRPEASGLANVVKRAEAWSQVRPLLMTPAAAEAIGISEASLRRWVRDGRLKPAGLIARGSRGVKIPVYGPAEIAAGRALRVSIKPGPVPADRPATKASPRKKVWTYDADQNRARRPRRGR